MSSDKITAVIENGIANVSYEANNRKKSKTIPTEALCKAILSGMNTGRQVNLSPLGLRLHGRSGDKVIVGYEFPERVANMPFTDDDGKKISFDSVWPWGLTFIEFSDTPEGLQWSTFYQFGLKGPITSLDTMMSQWPGSNVFGGHNCCIGEIKVPKIPSIEQTGGLPFIFYNGISNRDLSEKRFTPFVPEGTKSKITRPLELYRYLTVKSGEQPKPFPYDIMINAKTIRSFLTEKGYM
jgi:hypothetical protein